jgi:hypothetical protein
MEEALAMAVPAAEPVEEQEAPAAEVVAEARPRIGSSIHVKCH